MKTKNTGPFLVQTPYLISETSNKCLWPRTARMEMAYNLYFARIIENLSWFALLAKIHLISSSISVPGAFCM